jgi:hypothetical protein
MTDNPSVRLPRLIGTRNSARQLLEDLSADLAGVDVVLLARASSVCTYPVADELINELIVRRGARLRVHGASDELELSLLEAAEVHGVVNRLIITVPRPTREAAA